MQKLLEIKDGRMLTQGVKRSNPDAQQKLWNDSANVRFTDLSAEKAKGISNLGATPVPVTGMAQAFVSSQKRVYLGTASHLYRYVTGSTTQLAGATYTGTRWSMIPWGTWLLATNDVDPIQVCKDTTAAVALANVPVTHARIIRKLANRPIIFYGQNAAWPAATDIENWTPDPTTNAGNMFIRDLDSDVIAVEPMGELLAFYTRSKMGFATFIGGTSVYGFKIALQGIGAVGLNAVVPVGARHYGMSATGFWVTDGSGFDYIDAPDVNRLFDAQFTDKTLGDQVVAVHVEDRQCVDWYFPTPAGIKGLSYNYKTAAWAPLDIPITAALTQEVFDNPLAAAGVVWGLYDTTDDISGNVMASSLTSGAFDAGQPNNFKWWDMVQLNLESAGLVEVRFGLSYTETMGATAPGVIPGWGGDEWLPWATVARQNYVQREAPYLTMALRSIQTGTSWRLGGATVYGRQAGALQ